MNGFSKGNIFAAVLLSVIGVVCLVLGVRDFFQQQAWFARARQAEGTITAYDLHVRNDGRSEYCPRIEYTTQAGDPATTYRGDCPSAPDQSQIGRHVSFYYDPDNPSDTRTKGWLNEEGSGLIFGLVGFVFFPVCGSLGLIAELWRNRRQRAAAAAYQAGAYRQPGTSSFNSTMRRDAAQYHANQRAAERGRTKTDGASPADEEAQLARLKQQEAELERKIEERRRQTGQ